MEKYFLVLKTGAAEMRAYSQLRMNSKHHISPLIELTRGRKLHKSTAERTGKQYNFEAILNFVTQEVLPNQQAFLDITREDDLLSDELKELKSPGNGYSSWVNFVNERRETTKSICPVIQVNPNETDDWNQFESDLRAQFTAFAEVSTSIGYRANAKGDAEFDIDLQVLAPQIERYTHSGGKFYVFLDYGYVRPGTGELQSLETSEIFRTVKETCASAELVLVATSFPKSVTDVDGEERGDFRLEEVQLHAETVRRLHNVTGVHYGDYGSINPIRNDGIARGWRPRIDFPYGGTRLLYHREKRERVGGKDAEEFTAYSSHYRSVAAKVIAEPAFKDDPITYSDECWGVRQIRSAAQNSVPSSAAAFWISVRMNIHIEQQVRRLERRVEDYFADLLV